MHNHQYAVHSEPIKYTVNYECEIKLENALQAQSDCEGL